MTITLADQLPLLPESIDIFHPRFLQWFKQQFPECKKVVVFDKDDTLLTAANGKRCQFQHLINHGLNPLLQLKPEVVLVMYTVADNNDVQRDLDLFPEVFSAFDLVMTGDNYSDARLKSFCQQGLLSGERFLLQKQRMSKPVDKVFKGFPVVLIDDFVGTCWIEAEQGKHGIKAYPYAEDCKQNAQAILAQVFKLLELQLKESS